MIAEQVMGRATRDAFFLSQFEVKRLPGMMMGTALASLAAAFGATRLLGAFSPARVAPAAFATSGALLVALWGVANSVPQVAALALYLHMAVFGAALVSMFWSLVSERFDPRAAKRYIGRVASGATMGGILGGAMAFGASQTLSLPTSLLALAGLHFACCLGVLSFAGKAQGDKRDVPSETEVSAAKGSSAMAIVARSPYLLRLGMLVASVAALDALADYVLSARAAATFATPSELLSFFSLFHTGVAVVTFVLQATVSRFVLERFGLATAVGLLPALIIPLGAVGALVPKLVTAGALRGAMAAVEHSLYRSGYELLFGPVPLHEKRRTKTLVDVGFDRIGTLAGSSIILSAISVAPSWAPLPELVAMGFLAVLSMLVARQLHRGYIQALGHSLTLRGQARGHPAPEMTLWQTQGRINRAEIVQAIDSLRRENLLLSGEAASPLALIVDPDESRDSTEHDALVESTRALRSGDPARVRAELAAAGELDTRLAGHAVALLGDESVSREALGALRKIADRVSGQLADALLDRATPPVIRRRVARVMASCTTQRALDGLVAGLVDERFEVRYQCGLALLRITDNKPSLSVARDPVLGAVLREVELERPLWDESPPLDFPDDEPGSEFPRSQLQDRTSRSMEHVFAMLSLIYEREPIRRALHALSGDDEHLRGTALEYLEHVVPPSVKNALWPYVTARRSEYLHGAKV